jgi:hypothetical protein
MIKTTQRKTLFDFQIYRYLIHIIYILNKYGLLQGSFIFKLKMCFNRYEAQGLLLKIEACRISKNGVAVA